MFLKFLFLSSALTVLGGTLGVVFVKNIMHACVCLFLSLIGVAGLYVTLGADFVAATQLVVYVGGVVILMLFATMLTGGATFQEHNRFGFIKTQIMGSKKTYAIAIFVAALFFSIVSKILQGVLSSNPASKAGAFETTVEKIGVMLVTDHVLAFEVSSVLLLGALVGAALIARPRKEDQEAL